MSLYILNLLCKCDIMTVKKLLDMAKNKIYGGYMTKLMLVDDNKEVLSSYQYFLSKDKDIKVIAEAEDGETALKLYKKNKPDLMFLDLQIPKMNGLEIINELSKDTTEEKKCNIVICSRRYYIAL